jgi:hypothetical protein
MRTTWCWVALGLAVMTAGCTVRSLYPLYTEGDLIFEPRLLGTWGENDSKDTWTFRQSGAKAYEVIARESSGETRFEAHLLKLGSLWFLDVCSKGVDDAVAIPAHLFVQIRLEGDTLHVALLSWDWLRDMLARDPHAIAHLRLLEGDSDSFVLTAAPKELQKFVTRYAADPQAFSFSELRRQ